MSFLNTTRRLSCLCLLAACFGPASAAPPLSAPIAPVREVVDRLHGVGVSDPYRYFENVKSPEVQDWLKAQGAMARATLDKIEPRDRLEKRIAEMSASSGDVIREVVRMPGGQVYYLKRARDGKQFKLVMRSGEAGKAYGEERVLVDPEEDAKRTGMPHAVNYFMPSWDGKYVAYGMSAGGSEDASLYILDIASGKLVGQPVPRVHETHVSWAPDSKSLAFNQLKVMKPTDAESEFFLDSRVLWLKVGDAVAKAKPIFGPTVNKKLGLARLDVGTITFSPDSAWMIARTTDTTLPEGKLFIAKVADLGKKTILWQQISRFEDKITHIELKGDELYLLTHAGAPRFRVLKLDLRQPQLKNAVEVAVAPEGGVIEEVMLTRDALIASVREGTAIGIRRYLPGDSKGVALALPFKGAAVVHADPAHHASDVLYTLNGWTSLPQTFVLSGETSIDAGLRVNPPLPALPEIEISDVVVPSHDGAPVPMTILHKKGIALDGSNPTLLEGYASYGFSETAHYSAADMVWLEQGGIIAYANVRGSGVYGDDWYRAGFKATKANTWKDGIACAQYLIDKGYASSKTLAVMGGSAGGIFAGRSMTTAPQLFAAAVLNVGVMDALRAEESANGITNISEFGSAKNKAEFPALLEMSTYHQIKDRTAYPAVLLIHGMNDPRVDVWHSAKATARLQAATTSAKPVLLRLDTQAGHGIGSTATQRYAMAADIFSFLLWQMGKAPLKD